MDFLELHPHFMDGFQSKDPIKQLLIKRLKNMVSSTRIPLSLTLGGNTRQRIHGSAPCIMVLCWKVASHSMCPKGEPFPRQLGRVITTIFPHLPRRLSQAKVSLALIPLVGSMARRRGVEYGPSFEFLKH
jgi:hypothetical protein